MNTTQNQVTDALTEAIKTIADSSVQSKNATLTIEAEIVDVIDEGLGTYTVKYLGNKFEATTAHTEVTYQIGDMVYVLVPNGNFDKNKIILSPVNPSVASFAYASTDGGNIYIPISDDLFGGEAVNFSFSTWKPTNPSSYNNNYVYRINDVGLSSLFTAALKDSRTFSFTCKIRTNIDKDRRGKGLYGLELHIPVFQTINGEKTSTEYIVTLDVNNIIGDPYNLSVPALQNVYFTLPEDMEFRYVSSSYSYSSEGARILAFVKDFPGEDPQGPDDIFVTDIQLLSVLEVDKETMSGYYSVIVSDNGGNSFLPGINNDVKNLSVVLYLNGKIVKTNDFECYWFKENVGINQSSDKYHRIGGAGWEILNPVSEVSYDKGGGVSYQYVSNIYTQKIKQEEIHCDTKIRCILFKNDGDKGKKVIATSIIKNLASTAEIKLFTENGLTTFSKGIGNIELQLDYFENGITDSTLSNIVVGYDWQRIDKKGNVINSFPYTVKVLNKKIIIPSQSYYESDKAYYHNEIAFPSSIIDETNTILCTVYIETINNNSVIKQTIGTKSIIINIGPPTNGYVEAANGDRLYKYDSNGNSPLIADYDGPISSLITAIDPISIRIYKNDGTELSEDEYAVTNINWLVPINSMIKLSSNQMTDTATNPGYYTISGSYTTNNQLNYSIVSKYNKSKSDNTIIIQATAPNSILKGIVTGSAVLQFLKDGESGTNGSKYSAVITFNSYGYNEYDPVLKKRHKLQLIYVMDTQKWYRCDIAQPETYSLFEETGINFSVVRYIDGIPTIATDTGYNSDVTWKIFNQDYDKYGDIQAPYSPVTFDGNTLILKEENFQSPCCAIIEAKVRCNTNSSQGNIEYLYAYYPIECSVLSRESYLDIFIPTLDGGFSEVVYASDGTNPQWDTSPFVFKNVYDSINLDDYFKVRWNWSYPGIISPDTGSNWDEKEKAEIELSPIKKYDGEKANNFISGYLSAPYSSSQYLTNINTKIHELEQQKTNLENKIGYYQTLQPNLNVFTNFERQYNGYYYGIAYKNVIKEIILVDSVKTDLLKTVKTLLNQINQLITICNQYKNINETQDSKIIEIYNEASLKLERLNSLKSLVSSLGLSSNVSTQIQNINISTLILENKITYSGGIPERDCYFTINSYIDLYNNTINTTYLNYVNSLNGVTSSEQYSVLLMNWLNNFASSTELDNLTKIYYDCQDESYKYSSLIKITEGRLNSAYYNETSYSSVVNNIINPILNDVSWYVSFTNSGGYTSTINDLQSQVQDLDNQIQKLTNLKVIMQDVYGGGGSITQYKPAAFIYNRYELGFINGWDGNKLEVGDGYLVAPQLGAGIKNNDNSFTGIVLGIKQVKEQTRGDVGLFGYNQGIQSMFLNARNGSATFGERGAGQIIIEPSSKQAIIKSGNYNDKNNQELFVRVYPNYDANPVALGLYEYVLIPQHEEGYNTIPPKYDYVLSEKTRAGTDTAYYQKTSEKGGMLIDLSTPEIKFGTGNFKVTKEGHITAKGGGEIAGWIIGDTDLFSKVTGTNRITLHAGTDTWTDPPKIFSGTHNDINNSDAGFYLGPDGISITGKYTEDNLVKTSHFRLSTTGNPKLFSGAHDTLDSNRKGFYLSQDGFSISNGSQSRFEISTSGEPKLFSNSHSTLDTARNGFYLGNDGLSIGSKFYVDDEGILKVGVGAVGGYGWQKHWTIDGSSYDSYIKYGSEGESGSVYIGTNKISLGADFFVRSDGYLEAKNAKIQGTIEASDGTIAGWKISQNTLSSADGKIKLNSGGNSKFIEGPNAYIDLEGGDGSDGTDFRGCHISAKNVCFSAEKIWTTRSRGSTTLYEGQDCHYKIKTGYGDDYIRMKFINGILVETEATGGGWN